MQDGLFWDCSRMGEGVNTPPLLPKIPYTYLTMMARDTVISHLNKMQNMYK